MLDLMEKNVFIVWNKSKIFSEQMDVISIFSILVLRLFKEKKTMLWLFSGLPYLHSTLFAFTQSCLFPVVRGKFMPAHSSVNYTRASQNEHVHWFTNLWCTIQVSHIYAIEQTTFSEQNANLEIKRMKSSIYLYCKSVHLDCWHFNIKAIIN